MVASAGGATDGTGKAGRYHDPVMVDEVMGFLEPHGRGLYLDGTVGGGGHAAVLLERCPACRLLAVDVDPEALREARCRLAPYRGRVRFLRAPFERAVADAEVAAEGLAGALLDLGVSSRQLDEDERGFAFRRGVALDMRMDRDMEMDAARLLAEADEARLTRVFTELGEEPRGRRLAREVVRRRARAPFATSDDLVGALSATLGRSPTPREKSRIFQAVRIAVNDELDTLSRALPGIRDVLLAGAVLVVIAYHSLEDRIVKNAFREWSKACICPPDLPICTCRGRALGRTLTRRPLRPTAEEVGRNPRARSARLRAWRKAA